MKRFLRAPFFLLNYLFACCLILPLGARLNSAPTPLSVGPQRLVLILDGVPYQTIADLRASGHFKHFHEPAKCFPALQLVD